MAVLALSHSPCSRASKPILALWGSSTCAARASASPTRIRCTRCRLPSGVILDLVNSRSRMSSSAQSYCKQLRTRGIEAYVFHDGGTKTSSVCVGVFGKDAYDPRSTLYSAEVEDVFRRFPKHLVNGEPLMLPFDKSDPSKLRAQPPTLVEVPK